METLSLGNMKKVTKVLLVIIMLFIGYPVFADTTIRLDIAHRLRLIANSCTGMLRNCKWL